MMKRCFQKIFISLLCVFLMCNAEVKANQTKAKIIEGLSPSNTTIDLFDYAVSQFGENDYRGLPGNYHHTGINKDHQLKFTKDLYGPQLRSINTWTGRQDLNTHLGSPFKNLVKSRLENGYPVISKGHLYDDTNQTYEESLDYLFNHEASSYKRVYKDVKNLLTINEKGFYSYDSKKNFASFDEKNNSFILYDQPAIGVNPNLTADLHFGQFFPFSSLENTNGKDSNSGYINHFFGLHMSSNFMQPKEGLTANKQPMQFNFSGDDDVWVFIDGILVGDVGGIHDRLTLTIDFHEGYAKVEDGASYVSQPKTRSMVKFNEIEGLKEQLNESGRLKDGTYHTLDFFFLERGHGNSNLWLETNLVSIPKSDLYKINQQNDLIDGAKFELYDADENYHILNENTPLAKGETKLGTMTFVDQNQNVIDFAARYASNQKYKYYVLREVQAPHGYRKLPDIKLCYEEKNLGLVTQNMWETGAISRGSMNIMAPSVARIYGKNTKVDLNKDSKVFAVLLKRTNNIGKMPSASDNWVAVSGDFLTGYRYDLIHSIKDIENQNITKHMMEMTLTGKHELVIEGLPGNVSKYYDNLEENKKHETEYAIGYYLIQDGNLVRLESSDFERVYGSRITMTDPKNRLYVQKVDENKKPLTGVEFTVYKDEKPIETLVTRNLTMKEDGIDLEGGLVFSHLDPGIYYLKETSALPGYSINQKAIKVIVKNGVHVDAGSKNDGIEIEVGVGSLISSMAMFNMNDYDHTLKDIKATLQIASSDDLNYQDTKNVTHLTYKTLQYRPESDKDVSTFVIDEGFGQMKVQQDMKTKDPLKEDLGDQNLTSLFTGINIVRVTNSRVANVVVEKVCRQPEKLNDTTFDFEIDFHNQDLNTTLDAHLHSRKTGQKIGEKVLQVKNGKASFSLHAGEYLGILGISENTKYTIKELPKEHYILKSIHNINAMNQKIDHQDASVSDQIKANKVAHYVYTNTYEYEPVQTTFEFNKQYDGWKQTSNVSFEFAIASSLNTPMPEGAIPIKDTERQYVKMNVDLENKDLNHEFGPISYQEPGIYTYVIKELIPNEKPLGIGYSSAIYRVVVKVEDENKDGRLVVSKQMTKLQDDEGKPCNEDVKIATFKNQFTTNKTTINIQGQKRFIGFNANHDFYFKLIPQTKDAPMPSQLITKVDLENPTFDFGTIEYTSDDIGKIYEYEIKEVLENGQDVPSQKTNGIIYDQSKYQVTVQIEKKTDEKGIDYIASNMTYTKDGNEVVEIIFENKYEASTTYDLMLTKKIVGRDFQDGDKFTFKMDGFNDLIMQPNKGSSHESLLTTLTFTKPGIYTYYVSENLGEIENMTYDKRVIEVKLEVSDNLDGTLSVKDLSNEPLVFINTYKNVEKTPITPTIPNDSNEPLPPSNPNTGDHKTMMPYVFLGVSSLVVIAYLIIKLKHKGN